MTKESRDAAARKADRALVLLDQGLTHAVIAERLGVGRSHVNGMLQRARQRREKAMQEVVE